MKIDLIWLLCALFALPILVSHLQGQEFDRPHTPVIESQGISDRVINGTVYESARLKLAPDHRLHLPANSVVQEYDGSFVQFFITKQMQCSGHPPTPMMMRQARPYLGIAQRTENKVTVISTFGEWLNSGGIAEIRMLVLVPRGTPFEKIDSLAGTKSLASQELDLNHEALNTCYWYAGIGPADGWQTIETALHFNRFLSAK